MKTRDLLFATLLLAGCGGGGGSAGNATIVGRVLDVQTGGPPSPQASVSVPSQTSVLTAIADGSFVLTAPAGTTQLLVTSSYPPFTFTIPPASGTATPGDLWIGPEKVDVTGRVVDSSTAVPIAGASVTLAGISATSLGDGTFTLPNVAYSSTSQAAFWGITGNISATNYFATTFTTAPNVAAAGIVAIGDVLMTASNNPNPPGAPYDIHGRVLPIGGSSGTVVTLSLGATAVRVFNVGSDGVYTFWVPTGSYTISYSRGSQSAPQQNANVVQTNTIVDVPDVTLQ